MDESIHDVIGYRQLMILQCLWERNEPLTVKEIIAMIEEREGETVTNATITSLCRPLIDRGFVKSGKKRSRAFTYDAVITEEEYQQREINRMKKLTFGGSASDLVAALVNSDGISEEEYNMIAEIFKAYEK